MNVGRGGNACSLGHVAAEQTREGSDNAEAADAVKPGRWIDLRLCGRREESLVAGESRLAQAINPPAWHAKNPASGLGMDIGMSIRL